jgi:acetyl-CoA carboxylase biotin carboxyl carrier protein
MDIKQIQDLIRFVAKSGVNEVSIEQTDFKITIKTNQAPAVFHATMPEYQPVAVPVHAAPTAAPHAAAPAVAEPPADTINYEPSNRR